MAPFPFVSPVLVLISIILLSGCNASRSKVPDPPHVPEWSKEAVWYQIFVERFRNGDPTNDPTLEDMRGASPKVEPEGWKPTPWTHDWYELDDWAKKAGMEFYHSIYLRRYGGDLQGVLDKLNYLQDLGVTALYFNPINDAPSLHKYDARNYRHVDRNFGPDPRGDAEIMASEVPADPSTWQWTAADRLFLDLVDELHKRDMRLILDYSWNHTGVTFWAWEDILENQEASDYSDWYEIKRFDDPSTRENEFEYAGWMGVPDLPGFRKLGVPENFDGGPVEGTLPHDVVNHVFAVTRRWLDPNGDGDPSDGIDGFRLDVAEKVPLTFWRNLRRFVKEINPDAYLVGEVWWERWPDRMSNPRPYLGDAFDAVMHYQWYMPTRSLFTGAPPHLTPSTYAHHLDSIKAGIDPENVRAMMNLTASHDSPRFATSVYNPGLYKYHANPRGNADYKVDKPDDGTRMIQKQILVQQFTYFGAPHIWNGDEVGMWGADDPDPRKPLIWNDLVYDDEVFLPDGSTRHPDSVEPDMDLHAFYKQLIGIRKQHMDLFVEGSLTYLVVDDKKGILAYDRSFGGDHAVIVFNTVETPTRIKIPVPAPGEYVDALWPDTSYPVATDALELSLDPHSASILIRAK